MKAGHTSENIAVSALDTALAAINPDQLSPREALEALYHLKKLTQLTHTNEAG